jgi:hypothetical protein
MTRELKGGTLSIHGHLIEVASHEYLQTAVAFGRRVLDEYDVGVQNLDDPKLIGLLCELYDLTSARLCLVYDLDARCELHIAPLTSSI